MILNLRRLLLTVVALAAGLFWGLSTLMLVSAVALAGVLDWAVSGRSPELYLYQKGLGVDAERPYAPGRARALASLAGFALVSTGLFLLAHYSGGPGPVKNATNMAALLIAGLAPSYYGYRMALPSSYTPREQLDALDYRADMLTYHKLLKRPEYRITGAIVRIFWSAVLMVPLAFIPKLLAGMDLKFMVGFCVLGLTMFFQLGLLLLQQALFSLRWVRV